jgi:hypothetical protein
LGGAPATPTAAGDIDALNALAVAGRYPQPLPGPRFTTELTFGQMFTPISSTPSCTFNLGINPPPVPDVVTVTLNGATVPRDRSHINGWDYTDPTMRSFNFFGSWCSLVMSSRAYDVTIYFGCPNPG